MESVAGNLGSLLRSRSRSVVDGKIQTCREKVRILLGIYPKDRPNSGTSNISGTCGPRTYLTKLFKPAGLSLPSAFYILVLPFEGSVTPGYALARLIDRNAWLLGY